MPDAVLVGSIKLYEIIERCTSALAAQAAKAAGRTDVLAPGPLVRNEQGQPIGCQGLSRI